MLLINKDSAQTKRIREIINVLITAVILKNTGTNYREKYGKRLEQILPSIQRKF